MFYEKIEDIVEQHMCEICAAVYQNNDLGGLEEHCITKCANDEMNLRKYRVYQIFLKYHKFVCYFVGSISSFKAKH